MLKKATEDDDNSWIANLKEAVNKEDEVMKEQKYVSDIATDFIVNCDDEQDNECLDYEEDTLFEDGDDSEFVVDVKDTGVISAGNWFVLSGKIAELIKARKVFPIVIGMQTFRFDSRMVNIEAELENAVIASVQTKSAEEILLRLLSSINKRRAELEGYQNAVPLNSALDKAEKQITRTVINSRKWLRRGEMGSGLGALGTVSPVIPNAEYQQAHNRWQKEHNAVYIGVGVKLLCQLLASAGVKKVTLEEINRLLSAVNSGEIGAFLFRNPVREITNSYRRVYIIGVMGSNALHLPPDVAKAFYGDFDGDMYFLCMLLSKLKDAMKRDDVDLSKARITQNKLGAFELVPDNRLRLENVGTKTLPTSLFNGILALIGADARSGVGALHTVVVSMIDQVARLAGPDTAIKFGDAMLPLLEVIMDAGKETSKVKQMDFGLPFVDHLVYMMSLRTPAEFAGGLRTLADHLYSFFGENNEFAEKVEQAAEMMHQIATSVEQEEVDLNVGAAEALEAAYLTGHLPTPETMRAWLEGLDFQVRANNVLGVGRANRESAHEVLSEDEIERRLDEALEARMPVLNVTWEMAGAASQFSNTLATRFDFTPNRESAEVQVFNAQGSVIEVKYPTLRGLQALPKLVRLDWNPREMSSDDISGSVPALKLGKDDPNKPIAIRQKLAIDGINEHLTAYYKKHGEMPFLLPVIAEGVREERDSKTGEVRKVREFYVVLLAPVMTNAARKTQSGEVKPYYDTRYQPVATVGPIEIAAAVENKETKQRIVLAVKLQGNSRRHVLGGRFAFGKVDGKFGIIYQNPFAVLIDEMSQAVLSSSVVKIRETKDGKRVTGAIHLPLVELVQRAVERQVSAMFDTKNDADTTRAANYLKHILYVEDRLLNLIRRPIEITVRDEERRSVRVTLPRRKEIGYVALGQLVENIIRLDGRKRIYEPLKKDASRILWFDPASKEELYEMGIVVAATNFRRSVREQLPVVGLPFVVDGKRPLAPEMHVAFTNSVFLTAPDKADENGNHYPLTPDTGDKYTSVEGMLVLGERTIPVTRSIQIVLSEGGKTYAEQILDAIKKCGLKAEYIVAGKSRIAINEKLILSCKDDMERLAEFGIRFNTEYIADYYTIVRASLKVGADAKPDAFKLMFLEGTIKGVGAVLKDQKVVADLGDREVDVDIIAPATAVVEKKTGTVVFYGLAKLFGYTDLIEQFDAEILAAREKYEVGDTEECQNAEMEIAARYANELAKKIAEEHPGVEYNTVPLYVVEGDKRKKIGEGMVLKLRTIALPHTSATIGREDNFGSQMLLRQAALYKRAAAEAAGNEMKLAEAQEAVEVFRLRKREIDRLVSEVESLLKIGQWVKIRRMERALGALDYIDEFDVAPEWFGEV